MALIHSSHAIPFYPSVYNNARHKDYLVEVEDPDAVLEMLAKLGQSILRAQHEGSNAKRGLDLGLARGFSGSQAAKHLMGLAAANFAAGPGKKKRGGDMSSLSSTGRGDMTFGVPASAQDYLPASPPASSNEWILGNKE
ncbi:unnamed protein product [Allacma fusca]|uniref:Diuretic hormone 31 n=1 Tax=Allacma fusca TaxID=39272 RepID=A0A8J2JPL8_9HEXA|nr:unnamed protein product [Allacma fusca]